MSTVAQKQDPREWHFIAQRRDYNVFLSPSRYDYKADGSHETINGDRVWFDNFEFKTKDPELAERLRRHPAMAEGDYREIPVIVPPPPPEGDLEKVMALVVDRDAAALVELYADERQNWNRPAVITAIEKGLVALEAQGVELSDPLPAAAPAAEATEAPNPAPSTSGVVVGPPAPDPDLPVDDTREASGAARVFYE